MDNTLLIIILVLTFCVVAAVLFLLFSTTLLVSRTLSSQSKIKEDELEKKEDKPKEIPPVENEPIKELDHSLVLKIADEVIRIQKNLRRMDPEVKGIKQLNASIKRIQNNFSSNGYDLVDMLDKEYNEGMKVIANFIPNEDLESGQQIITRIIKPQVNFEGEMIQAAQIEVSVGE